jgi:hypothetical protein
MRNRQNIGHIPVLDRGWDQWGVLPRWQNLGRGFVQMTDMVADQSGDSYQAYIGNGDPVRKATADERREVRQLASSREHHKQTYVKKGYPKTKPRKKVKNDNV